MERSIEHGELMGNEELIAFADGYAEDELFMQEFVVSEHGAYRFYDCTPYSEFNPSQRSLRCTFFDALTAAAMWKHDTGQHLALDYVKSVAVSS